MIANPVAFTREGDVGYLTLDQSETGNALDAAVLAGLDEAILLAEQDIDVKVLVVRASGPDFSIGADYSQSAMSDSAGGVSELQRTLDSARAEGRRWESLFNFPRPTIAQVQGRCLGPGFTLALCCDLVFVAEDAQLGDPSVAMGLLPSLPIISWLVGPKKARELVCLGRLIDGREAAQMRLVNQAVPAAELSVTVDRYARAIALSPADGLAFVKEAINAALEARGVGAGWRFTTDLHLARPRPTVRPGEFDFFATRDTAGLAAAVRQRDALLKGP
ncbi:MAG: enoyl-CoA hydratase/isomerase family protein [Chloroflexi bacterium]|nr:enoyl-CoA hydratase/isomerase family protein [Chloroflexota bacterium]